MEGVDAVGKRAVVAELETGDAMSALNRSSVPRDMGQEIHLDEIRQSENETASSDEI